MNANEIAKDLEREGKFPGHICYGTSPLLVRAANMLKKQQAEIEALKLQLHTTLTNRNLEKPAKYSDAWWKEVAEFNKTRKAQKK